ncbi:DEAD/DEAH box helicase [Candidatus Woesearchaeota archaeon]|nr:DEAD/DEAH box helicase [Candidatus Woesearchaeota archaeon]MBT4387767.1 DEAD/DEAH box helicase [Candidatus Woesearchaeota archaeon]MBT4595586.1 DEAD/DEAH box helicase [Candidatus Woesearchaeota archaeon]MBT5740931.1 DEAD/DEAH box helicase [Candidatus Woesearchaeota archaeon]MBT6505533.1 DEAD/DEAH box helicase [Candidatus Woesearchaeota archaeon]
MIKPRKYQLSIINTAYNKNTLVVLPTGLGKTLIAFLLSRIFLNKYKNKKILFFAPTRPLVLQHEKNCNEILSEFKSISFTGSIKSDKRSELFKQNDIIFSTPQGFENDIISNKINLSDVSLIIFDEAHRSVGNYSYNYISNQFNKKNKDGRLLALTASPGSNIETIGEVCKNLFIGEIEYRSAYDHDVREYVQDSAVIELKIKFPDELKTIQSLLNSCLKSKLKDIKDRNYLNFDLNVITKTKLLMLQSKLSREIINGDKNMDLLMSVSLCAQALKCSHAVELLETQTLHSLNDYFDSLFEDSKKTKVKATINLVKDSNFITARNLTKQLLSKQFIHPKLGKLNDLLKNKFSNNKKFKCIIFNQYRDSAISVYNHINGIENVNPILFFGQAKKKGMGHSQVEQKRIIEDFRNSKYNVLIATSVAEEGLDIPLVKAVIFFEPVPSAIRTIQRRGRTARDDYGETYVLINEGTRDEAYKWSSFHKEKRMYRILKDLKNELSLVKVNKNDKQLEFDKIKTLAKSINMDDEHIEKNKLDLDFNKNIKVSDFENDPLLEDDEITLDVGNNLQLNLNSFVSKNKTELKKEKNDFLIIVDHREKASNLIKEFEIHNIKINLKSLNCADYILSENVAIEYKLDDDFIQSIFDGRLFTQAKELSSLYLKPIMVIESNNGIFNTNNISNSQIFGAITSLLLDYNIPVIFTRNKKETVDFFISIIKREQGDNFKYFNPHTSNKPKDTIDQIEYVISALPSIGFSLAKVLLYHFKSLKNIANAKMSDLLKVEKIGESKAKYIFDIFNKKVK